VFAGGGFQELCRNPYLLANAPHASFNDVLNAERAPDFAHVDRTVLVNKRRVSGDHTEGSKPAEFDDDVFRDSVSEILIFRIAAHIEEREDSDRWCA
jgi:hypothetical protein